MNKNPFINRVFWGMSTLLVMSWWCIACNYSGGETAVNSKEISTNNEEVVIISDKLPWSKRMAESVIKRNPEPWMIDFREMPRWGYTNGLVLLSIQKLWEESGDDRYYNYAKVYADELIDEQGRIVDYDIEEYNIDHINPGKILFLLYEKTGDLRYKKAMDTLKRQLDWQPRTSEGGFWHKLKYTWQMWLDGLYMGAPYYAQYAKENNIPEAFDDIAHQLILIEEKTRDEKTGLLYHGWDESRLQKWADPETGCSPNFWGRAVGWYAMALVDVLDYFPEDHSKRGEIISILNRLSEAIENYQDPETGVWYQVLDQKNRKGNYKEASVSCMFVYSIAKAINKGYIDSSRYHEVVKKGYEGILEYLINVHEDGEVEIINCCSVAGLGGTPYRDGSYEYYISEHIRSNDPKAVGPFILASLEMEKQRVNSNE